MRRSAAPSQLQGNPFKKPKFISPARSHPSPNEEVAKLNSEIKLFEVAANKNNFLQPQNDPRICNFNLPTEECAKGINHGDNHREKYCLEASTKATLDPSYSANLDEEAQAGTSSLQVMLDRHPVAITVEVKQEEDIKPPPPLVLNSQQSDTLEQREEQELVRVMERSLSPSLSSVDMRMTSSPSSIPRRDDFFRPGENFRSQLGYDPQILQMLKEEHQIILENQKSFGLYVQEKRDGLKRRQQLEEELLRAKIEVEKLKAIRLRHDLPEYNSL